MKNRIYLDNNATTALDPKVFEAMCFDLCQIPRNPSSVHSFGQEARNELTRARRVIADSLGVEPEELLFSSGGSESNNYLLKGFFELIFPKQVITTRLEHSSILKNVEAYKLRGGSVQYLPVNQHGAPRIEDLRDAISEKTGLIVLMAVNNETGVKTDLQAFAKLAEEKNIPFIVDGVALMGKEPFKIFPGITAMSFSAHKFHGPKGVGITYLKSDYELPSMILGGGQEEGKRAGTHNLGGILGLSKAIELLDDHLPQETHRMENLRAKFESELQSRLEGVHVNGEGPRICNTSCLAFDGVDGESLMMNLDLQGIACSHGSACSSGSLKPSRVLSEMGLDPKRIHSSLRFALSRMTTEEEINRAVDIIEKTVKEMRAKI